MTATTLVLVAALMSSSLAAPQRNRPGVLSRLASIFRQENNFNGIDPWNWSYILTDGTVRQEEGKVKNDELKVKGSYMFVAPEGSVHKVAYEADKDGYRASSEPPDQELLDRLGTNTGLSLIGK